MPGFKDLAGLEGLDNMEGFDGQDAGAEEVTGEVADTADGKNKESKEQSKKLLEEAKKSLEDKAKDPEWVAIENSLINSVKVINTLGYPNSKGIVDRTQERLAAAEKAKVLRILPQDSTEPCYVIVAKGGEITEGATKLTEGGKTKKKYVVPENRSAKPDKDGHPKLYRAIVTQSQVVGYALQNIGTKPISYATEVWTKDAETGLYVGNVFQKVFEPNTVINLTKKWTAKFAINPGFNLQFANGSIIGSIDPTDIDATLEACYFSFSKTQEASVHDESVKKPIFGKSKDADGNEVVFVKEEYIPTFGFLMNPAPSAGKKDKGAKGRSESELKAEIMRNLVGM